MADESHSDDVAIDAAMTALSEGRLEGLQAEDRDVGALVRISDKERDRYLVVTGDGVASAREEWRSGSWIRRMLERGHWRLLPPPDAPAWQAAAPPSPPSAGGTADGLRLRSALRTGHVEVALPFDATAEDMRLARAELARFSGVLELLAASKGS